MEALTMSDSSSTFNLLHCFMNFIIPDRYTQMLAGSLTFGLQLMGANMLRGCQAIPLPRTPR
jgi:hypothetical protein